MTSNLIKRYIGRYCTISTGSLGATVRGLITEVMGNCKKIVSFSLMLLLIFSIASCNAPSANLNKPKVGTTPEIVLKKDIELTDGNINVASNHQLFLDTYVISELSGNYFFKVNPATEYEGNPVLTPSNPWEAQTFLFGSVLKINGVYKMWYFGYGPNKERYLLMAESRDGKKWEKPLRSIVLYDGKPTNAVADNNILPYMYETYSVLYTEDAPKEEKYKLLYVYVSDAYFPADAKEKIIKKYEPIINKYKKEGKEDLAKFYESMVERNTKKKERALGTAVSPDGINWTVKNAKAANDVRDISHLFYDDVNKKYIIYGRDFGVPEDVFNKYKNNSEFKKMFLGRGIQYLESTDCSTFTTGEPMLFADIMDPEGDEIYSMTAFKYEGIYIGLVQMYHSYSNDTTNDVQLAVSRDGKNWQRLPDRTKFFGVQDIGGWNRFNTSIASNMVTVGDELRFYYSGRTIRHSGYDGNDTDSAEKTGIGFASVPKDRFAGLCASFDGATMTTKILNYTGTALHINTQSKNGRLKIELLSDDGVPFEVFKPVVISEDTLNYKIEIPKEIRGIPVRLRATLENSYLYSFWFE